MAHDGAQWRWILPVLLMTAAMSSGQQTIKATKQADMESSDCDKIGGYIIDDSDIMQVFANVPQVPGGYATRNQCVVEVRTTKNRRLRIYVMDITIFDCGIRIDFFDGNTHMSAPTWPLNCDSKPGVKFDSRSEAITIRLTKQSPAALSFRFNFVITTDQGPDIAFEQNMSGFNTGVLSIGAIVGIAIAGGLLFLAVVAIIIYCVIKQRQKNLDAEKPQSDPQVYTSVAVGERRARRERYEMSRPRREYI